MSIRLAKIPGRPGKLLSTSCPQGTDSRDHNLGKIIDIRKKGKIQRAISLGPWRRRGTRHWIHKTITLIQNYLHEQDRPKTNHCCYQCPESSLALHQHVPYLRDHSIVHCTMLAAVLKINMITSDINIFPVLHVAPTRNAFQVLD